MAQNCGIPQHGHAIQFVKSRNNEYKNAAGKTAAISNYLAT